MAFLGPSLRRRKLRERPAARATAAISLSIVANLALLALLAAAGVFDVKVPPEASRVSLSPLSASQWEQNRALSGVRPPQRGPDQRAPAKAQAQRAPPPKPPAPPPRMSADVVDVAPGNDKRPPPGTGSLAERDNSVEKETISRDAGRKLWDRPAPSASDETIDGTASVPGRPGEAGRAQRSRPGRDGPKPSERAPTRRPQDKPADQLALAPRVDGDAPVSQAPSPEPAPGIAPRRGGASDLGVQRQGADGQQGNGPANADLRPDAGILSRVAGGPGVTWVDGIDISDATALNTRAFRYSTFIIRFVRGIIGESRVGEVYLARDPELDTYPLRRWEFATEITLDQSGRLEDVRLLRPSGLDFVDREFVRAVRAAAPFPNPPSGLVDRDGKVRLANNWYIDTRDWADQLRQMRRLR